MRGDLHTHTSYSDGSTPIEKMAHLASRAGLGWLAISDHDSVQSVRYAYAHPVEEGVNLIPATELSAYDFARGRRVHLLCYWPDDCAALREFSHLMSTRRREAVAQSCRELEELCPQFSTEDALRHAVDSDSFYKAHVMRALMDYGLADGIYNEVYHDLFGSKPGQGKILHKPAYESVDTVLDVIRQSRAVVVLAHPSTYHSMELAEELIKAGRIDGVEMEHPRNTPQDKETLRQWAKTYDLIVTGGTDYHGMNTKAPHPVGYCTTEETQILRIQALAQHRKG